MTIEPMGHVKTLSDGSRRATGRGVPFTDAEENLIISMFRGGATDKEIAAAFGCKRDRINDKRKQLNLRRGSPCNRKPPEIPVRVQRRCLSCRRDFHAEHKGNWLCPNCKTRGWGGW